MHRLTCVNNYSIRCNNTQFIYIFNCSTCFGWYLHPSSGFHNTVSTVSGINETVTATCSQRDCRSHPVTFMIGSSNGLVNARYCRYSVMSSWCWVKIPPETCRAVTDINKLYIVANCWAVIDTYSPPINSEFWGTLHSLRFGNRKGLTVLV